MRTVRLALVPLMIALVAPVPAQAQFGGLVKKAAEKAAGKAVEQAGKKTVNAAEERTCSPLEFDNTMVELTSERVDQVVKGLQARARAGGAKRDALVKRRAAAEARLADLENSGTMRDAAESEREWKRCRDEQFQEIIEKRIGDNGGAAAMSPQFMRAMREHNDKIEAAQAKGDTARANALQDSTLLVYYKVYAPTKADSAAADAKCGPPPKASRRIVERDSLRREVRTLGDQIREIDEDAEDEVSKASGMTRTQLAMAIERLRMATEREMAVCRYSKAERDAIAARKEELQKLLNTE